MGMLAVFAPGSLAAMLKLAYLELELPPSELNPSFDTIVGTRGGAVALVYG
jgi:hypothetical protein